MVSGVPGISLHSAVGVESLVLPGPHLLCACNARINAACGGEARGRRGRGAELWDRWVLSYCGTRPLIFRELCFPRKVNTSRLPSLISTPPSPLRLPPPPPPAAAPGDLQPWREKGGGGGGRQGERNWDDEVRWRGRREKRREVLQTKVMKSDPGGRTRRERRTGGGGRGVRGGERCDPGF